MKIGNNIVKKLGIFMSDTDKKIFSELLFGKFQSIYLIDNKRSENKNIKLLSFLSDVNVTATILNSSIFSLDDYKKLVEMQSSPPYSFPMVVKGMIQYVPSNIAQYDSKCLKDGYLSASYYSDDLETEHFVKEVFKMVGQNGKKVFLTSKYRDIVADVAEKNIVAWPNAAIEYNGNNGRYLTQTKERMLISQQGKYRFMSTMAAGVIFFLYPLLSWLIVMKKTYVKRSINNLFYICFSCLCSLLKTKN